MPHFRKPYGFVSMGCAVGSDFLAQRLFLDGFDPRQIRPRLPAHWQARSAPAQSGADGFSGVGLADGPLPAGLRPSAIGPGKGPPDLCFRVLWHSGKPAPFLVLCAHRTTGIGRPGFRYVSQTPGWRRRQSCLTGPWCWQKNIRLPDGSDPTTVRSARLWRKTWPHLRRRKPV